MMAEISKTVEDMYRELARLEEDGVLTPFNDQLAMRSSKLSVNRGMMRVTVNLCICGSLRAATTLIENRISSSLTARMTTL